MSRAVTQISETQANKTTTINELFEAMLAAADFGIARDTTDALTFGYYGASILVDGVLTTIADGTLALTAGVVNYVERTQAGVVSSNVSGFTAGRIPLYEVTTSVTGITTVVDRRPSAGAVGGRCLVDVSGSPSTITLTAAQARCRIIELVGALTAGATVVFPAVKDFWVVRNNTSGSQTITLQSNDAGSPTPASISLTSTGTSLIACNGSDLLQVAGGGSSTTSSGIYGARGVRCQPTPGSPTSTTQYDLVADEISLRNASGENVVRINPGAAITVNVATAGSIANGRDQAGAFSSSSWVHFYWIWNGTTLAGLASASPPPTGPTLPTGYTHWAYAGAVRFNGSSQLVVTYILGGWAIYEKAQSALSGGSATTETTIDISALVPPNAGVINLQFLGSSTNTGAANQFVSGFVVGSAAVTANAFWSVLVSIAEAAGVTTQWTSMGGVVANLTQTLYYRWTQSNGAAYINVLGYSTPNGG